MSIQNFDLPNSIVFIFQIINHKLKSLYAFPVGATTGTYLQKSSMGGSYSVSAIAEKLGLKHKSGSDKEKGNVPKKEKVSEEKTSVKTRRTLSNDAGRKLEDKKQFEKKVDEEDEEDEKEEDEEEEEKETKKDVKKSQSTKKVEEEDEEEEETKKDVKKSQSAKKVEEDDEEDEKEDDEKKPPVKKVDKDEKEDVDKDDEEENDTEGASAAKSLLSGVTLTQKDSISTEDALKKLDEKKQVEDDEKEDDEEGEKKSEAGKEDDDEKNETKDEIDEDKKDEEKDDEKDKEKEDENDEKEEDETEEDDEEEKKPESSVSSAVRLPAGFNSAHQVHISSSKHGVRVPGAGAQKALMKPSDMDKYRQIIELRKKQLEVNRAKSLSFLRPLAASIKKTAGPGGKVVLQAPGKRGDTQVMRANTPGTLEFDERKRQILERIKKSQLQRSRFPLLNFNKKINPSDNLVNKSKLPFKKEPKAPGIVRRSIEKVPVVKRIFKMSPEEELILDASLSFVTGLKHGIFMKDGPLDETKKSALKGWLNLLSVGLPPEWGLHALIDALLVQINFISQKDENLQSVINKYPLPRQSWSKSCDKYGNGGFSCGMWKLFHIVTVGIAEHRGGLNLVDSGLMDRNTVIFSPIDAADTIYEYMANFFGCDDCREHFIKQYDNCSFRRCERLTSDKDNANADDWKQLALWMWEVHNDVNIRVAAKKVDRIQKKLNTQHLQGAQQIKIVPKQEDEIRVLWPSLESCLLCFDDSGKWNEDSVFEFIERTYWDAPNSKFDRLLTNRNLEGEDPAGGGIIWLMMIVAVAIVVFLRRHVNNLSFRQHLRKMTLTSVIGVKNKIEDAVAGKHRTA